MKELLFAGGRNLYAEDVEAIACEAEGVKRAVAAWTANEQGDPLQGLFVVVEPDTNASSVLSRAREHVARRTGLAFDVVEAIEPRDIPRTMSGKVQRGRLGARLLALSKRLPAKESPDEARHLPSAREQWEALVRRIWAEVLGLPDAYIPLDTSFAALGGSSLSALEVQGRLEAALGAPLEHEVLLSSPTVSALAGRLASRPRTPSRRAPLEPRPPLMQPDEPIAIVGMACRLPLGDSPEAFWSALLDGKNAIRAAPADRWRQGDAADLPHVQGSWLDDPWAFDRWWLNTSRARACGVANAKSRSRAASRSTSRRMSTAPSTRREPCPEKGLAGPSPKARTASSPAREQASSCSSLSLERGQTDARCWPWSAARP